MDHRFKHGESGSRLYHIWEGMKQRISNFKNKKYKKCYIDKGITICPEWAESYIVFRDWALNNGYKDGLTIDRKENDGNYKPLNCQWISYKENNIKRECIKLTLKIANKIRELDKTGNYTQRELAEKYNIDQSIISLIVNNKIWRNS